MLLHEAIEKVIKQNKRGMSVVEITSVLNQNKWYTKGNGTAIKSSQISARVKNYPQWFKKENGIIYLANSKVKTTTTSNETLKNTSSIKLDNNLSNQFLEERLMNEKYFKSAGKIDGDIIDKPGIYCIRIKNGNALCFPFNNILKERKHNIIYIGLASKSLKKRFLGQELKARGHGTFFRSIGAVLGFTPEKGSLVGKKNQNNYVFSPTNEQKIIQWINDNLMVNWVYVEGNLNLLEDGLIKKYLPLLNTSGNPSSIQELKELRMQCKMIARGMKK